MYSNKTYFKIIDPILLIIILYSTFFTSNAFSYSGYADLKMVVIDKTLNQQEFDPNRDLLKQSELEGNGAGLRKAVVRSALESLIPLSTYIKDVDFTGNNILGSILNAVSISYKRLSEKALQDLRLNREFLPFIHDIYLMPLGEEEGDLFYSSEKVAINGIDQINLLGIESEYSPEFAKAVTDNVKELQKKYSTNNTPFSLLAFRRSIVVSSLQQRLSYYFLIQLNPREDPFVKESDKVNIKRVVIPDNKSCEFGGVVALLTVDLDFNKYNEDPEMNIRFGSFDRYESGNFFLNSDDKDRCLPRLEGDAVGKLGRLIDISFGFKELLMNLQKQEISELDIYTRPGLKLGGANSFAPIFFNAESIDNEFKGEINKSIDEAIKGFLDKLFIASSKSGTK